MGFRSGWDGLSRSHSNWVSKEWTRLSFPGHMYLPRKCETQQTETCFKLHESRIAHCCPRQEGATLHPLSGRKAGPTQAPEQLSQWETAQWEATILACSNSIAQNKIWRYGKRKMSLKIYVLPFVSHNSLIQLFLKQINVEYMLFSLFMNFK